MSSSSYGQGLQSCLEPAHLVEPLVLRLKLAPSKSDNSHSLTPCKPSVATDSHCDSKSNENVDTGGWSFLQSLANVNNASQGSKENKEKDIIYVPPTVKRSSSMLSEKSLEMCTESLGSETGSNVSESSDEMALLSVNINYMNYETRERTKMKKETSRKMTRSASFPPPLTSISGSSSVQVRSHREGGRLIMEAVSVSTCRAYFHAERINGRLRLHLMKDCSSNNENEEQEEEKEEAEETEEQAYGDDEEVVPEDEMEGEDGEGEGKADDGDGDEEEEMEGNRGNDGGEMGMGGGWLGQGGARKQGREVESKACLIGRHFG